MARNRAVSDAPAAVRPRAGTGALVRAEDVPEAVRAMPAWVRGIWCALASGRRYSEAAGAGALAAERACEAGEDGYRAAWWRHGGADGHGELTKQDAWRAVRDRRWTAAFKEILDDEWKPLAEPARDVLAALMAEGLAAGADGDAKDRALAAAKLALSAAGPPHGGAGAAGGGVRVDVRGDATVTLGLDALLAGREPLRPRALSAAAGGWAPEPAPEPVDATQPGRSRTSSRRTGEERRNVRERREG